MKYSVTVDGILSECNLSEEEVCFTSDSAHVNIRTEDIIGCEVVPPYFFFRRYALYLWYITKHEKKLAKASICITGDEEVCEKLRTDIQEKVQHLSNRPKALLVLINPIGGNKTALKDFRNTVEPIFKIADIKCDVKVSERHKHMVDIVKDYDFKGTDGIVILGGDGSFSEAVNVLMRKEQERASIDINDPTAEIRPITIPIGMIPSGSGNYIALQSTGFTDVLNSTLHVLKGDVFQMNMVGVYADRKLVNYAGVTASYRGFTDLIYYADTCRWLLGRLRYYIVPFWLSFFKPYLQTFEAEVTYYANITESESDTSLDQNVDQKEIFIDGKKLDGVKTYTKDSVVIGGNLKCIAFGNKDDNDRTDGQVFSTTNFDDSMTELQLLKFLKDAMNKKDIEVDFAKSVTTRGVKAKIKYEQMDDGSHNDTLKHIIQVDGEFHEMKELEFQFWLHRQVIPLFTSAM